MVRAQPLQGAMVAMRVGAVLLVLAGAMAGSNVPAPAALQEIDHVHIRLEGIKEKCLVEELPEKTVVLGKMARRRFGDAAQ